MPKLGIFIASAVALTSLAQPAIAQNSSTYRVPANDTANYNLRLCSSVVDVTVQGDQDTDLDFVVTDDQGNTVHRDFDSTDIMQATLRPNVSNGCRNYTLRIANLGDVYNVIRVRTTDRGSAAGSGGSSDGRNRAVSIHNHTAETFREVYWSNTADGDWKSDRLGTDTMRARTNRTFNIDDGTGACRFDFKVVTMSGQNYFKRNINVCSVSTVEFGTEIQH